MARVAPGDHVEGGWEEPTTVIDLREEREMTLRR